MTDLKPRKDPEGGGGGLVPHTALRLRPHLKNLPFLPIAGEDSFGDHGEDSRFIGCIPRQQILGRVPRVILSFNPARHYLPRFQRILQPMTLSDA